MRSKMLFLCFILFSLHGFANSESEIDPLKARIYVNADQILLHEKQIFVDLGQGWIPVRDLTSDANGFYVRSVYSDPDDITPGTWLCPCGFINRVGSACRNPECTYK